MGSKEDILNEVFSNFHTELYYAEVFIYNAQRCSNHGSYYPPYLSCSLGANNINYSASLTYIKHLPHLNIWTFEGNKKGCMSLSYSTLTSQWLCHKDSLHVSAKSCGPITQQSNKKWTGVYPPQQYAHQILFHNHVQYTQLTSQKLTYVSLFQVSFRRRFSLEKCFTYSP